MNSPVISQSNTNSDRQSDKPPGDLPDKPIVIIESRRGSLAINLYDLWQYRDLLYILSLRDIKVRYKQTVLGILWVIIQPLFMMIVFTLFFGRLAGIPSDGIPYPLFAYAGLLPWTFFSNALNSSGNSLNRRDAEKLLSPKKSPEKSLRLFRANPKSSSWEIWTQSVIGDTRPNTAKECG
jgi:hypothetical protein